VVWEKLAASVSRVAELAWVYADAVGKGKFMEVKSELK
jgi:hypothetical protein